MPFTLPASTGAGALTDPATDIPQQKTNLGNLRGFIAEMLGTDSTSRGAARSSLGIDGPTLTVTPGSSAWTLALKSAAGADGSAVAPVSMLFRSSTLASAAVNVRQVTAALSLVLSSGSTLGMSNATDAWLYVYALDNSGSVELAVSATNYGRHFIGTSVAEGGAGAADSATTIYSAAARTSVPMRLLAAVRANQATAGAWVSGPVEVIVADALDGNLSGANTWQDVTGSRALATNYVNTSNKEIEVFVTCQASSNGATFSVSVAGSVIGYQSWYQSGQNSGITFPVAPGAVYRADAVLNATLFMWKESK